MSKDAGAAAFRKTWDKEAFEAKAKARLDEELRLEEEREANIQAPQPIVQRAPLQRREADLQLTKFVNQRQMVTLGQAANGEMSGVYWCAVCQCHLRDSANYLLHINGKKHNRMLGMSMRAERATVGEVRERLASYKEEKQPELTKEEKAALFLDDFNQRVAAREEEEYQALASPTPSPTPTPNPNPNPNPNPGPSRSPNPSPSPSPSLTRRSSRRAA